VEAGLFEVLSQEDAEATLVDFVRTWHGEPAVAVNREDEAERGEALRSSHDYFRAWPRLVVQDQLLSPPERLSDGRIMFLVENQAVYSWATDGTAGDSRVWGRWNEEGAPWVEHGERLGRFHVQVAVNEAIWGASHAATAGWLPRSEAEQVIGHLAELPYAP
jgi:hypothetical protein